MDPVLPRQSTETIKALQDHCQKIIGFHKQYSDLRNKAEAIDTKYYRYQTAAEKDDGNTSCGITIDNMVIPIVISQVDSFVGYLAEVYLSGYPIFPAVSPPKHVALADKLEAVVDTQATRGQYARYFLSAFRNGMRYNYMPILTEWRKYNTYQLVAQSLNVKDAQKLEQAEDGYTCVKNLSVYNTIWDYRYRPTEVASRGDFVGYVERISRTEAQKLILDLQRQRIAYNLATLSNLPRQDIGSEDLFKLQPQISDYTTSTSPTVDWSSWLDAAQIGNGKHQLTSSTYDLVVLYIRIIPKDFKIDVPTPAHPQIFKVWMLGGQLIVGFDRVITQYGEFPISIGQPLDDDFGVQTPSLAETQVGFQTAASTLFSIRVQGARRAVHDRALYDPTLVNPSLVNSTHPAAKIPIRLSGLQDRNFESAYKEIPFRGEGLQTVIEDMNNIFRFSDQASGLNAPFRGQFQKGNKSVEEWRDTMGSADNRLRLPALNIEFQSMMQIKEAIKWNIFMRNPAGHYTNMKNGESVEVTAEDFAQMQAMALQFRLADGYTPKSKLASTDFIMSIMQIIGQSQVLQQTMGPMLPNMLAHLAQLGGVRDLAQYMPQLPQQGGEINAGTSTPAT